MAVLAELEADLEGLYRHLRRGGMDEMEAVRRAQRVLSPDRRTITRLVRLHTRGWRRLTGRLSGRVRRGFEYGALGASGLMALAGAGLLARGTLTLSSSDPLLWTVIALGTLTLAAGAAAVGRLFLFEKWSPRLSRLAFPVFAWLGGTALGLGIVGGLLRLQAAATARAAGRLGELELVARLGREATLAATSLCVAFAAGALGFLVVNRIRALQEEDVARFL